MGRRLRAEGKILKAEKGSGFRAGKVENRQGNAGQNFKGGYFLVMGIVVKSRNGNTARGRVAARSGVLSRRSRTRFYKKTRVLTSQVHGEKKKPALGRHNRPGLVQRRSLRIAESNLRRTKKSDDALVKLLKNFQKLTF